MKKLLNYENLFLAVLIILAAAVRFYDLNKLAFFTYDQARDALYIKRILVDHKLRLIGTQSSIPGLYTGPLYYYLVAPFLAIFALNPIGLDVGTAFFSTLAVALLYYLAKNLSGSKLAGFLAATLFAFQPQIVAQSRFAWNPNPMPLFTLIFIWGWWLIDRSKLWGWWLIFLSLGVLLQLHYSGVCFLLALPLLFFVFRKKIKLEKNFWSSLFVFGLIMSPLPLFELRHNFSNTKAILNYLQGGGHNPSGSPYLVGLLEKARLLFSKFLFGTRGGGESNLWLAVIAILLIFAFKNKKVRNNLQIPAIVLGTGILVAGLYKGSFFDFYLTFLYPVSFLLWAVLVGWLFKKSSNIKPLIIIMVLVLTVINFNQLRLLFKPTRTIEDVILVSQTIANDIDGVKRFNLAGVLGGDRYDYNAVDYRYFVEAYYGKRALGWEAPDYQNSQILYLVVKNNRLTNPLTSNVMEIKSFGPNKIKKKWELQKGFTIYRLEK